MCDVCADFLHLLVSYETRISSNDTKHSALLKSEIETAFSYIQSWPQRQCMCCYRDAKNFERFNLIVQSMICLTVCNLRNAKKLIEESKEARPVGAVGPVASGSGGVGAGGGGGAVNSQINNNDDSDTKVSPLEEKSNDETKDDSMPAQEEKWSLSEIEKLLLLVSKAFLLNFPLYIAYKHGVHSRLDEITAEEAQSLSMICDLHDNEIPAFLLRNVSLFCNSGGFGAMQACFEHTNLPVTTAHAITAAVSNLKLWLNYRCIVQLFVPLRVKVLQYMCKLSDQDLRSPSTRSMADFMWSAIRDPLDATINFDVEGLALAFKYFNSTTLTMRLAGMAQINAHINLFNEICTTETVGEVEVVGQKLADWLTENLIISHLFGPNLHVEVIKQSHVVLNFLAVENQITEEHINLIWQAAQLKHCSKPIYDILPSLVKNLAPRPAMHLYSLLCHLDPKEHTEQSIYIASALTKLIWSRDGTRSQVELPPENIVQTAAAATSSENSVSIDGSNTEEDQQDDDSSTSQKSPIDIEGGSDCGATPCKQARHKEECCDEIDDANKVKMDVSDDFECIKVKESPTIAIKNRRMSNIEDGSSSEDDATPTEGVRKKIRKRRKNNNIPLTRLAHELVEAIWGVESPSEGDVGVNDSDCSETQMQTSVLSHLHSDGPFISTISDSHLNELLSGGENDGSYSSPMSNKSEKNMADFDDDESPCEEEIAHLASRAHCLAQFTIPRSRPVTVRESSTELTVEGNKIIRNKPLEVIINKEEPQTVFKISDVCQPGNTLLWDLLQDDKIGQLGESLALEAEKALGTLLCFSTDRFLRTKFIEGCLQNLATNKSVIVSLRLLPKLFASFQQFRATDTHQVTMWAERQHRMMHHFFSNLKYYTNSVKNHCPIQVLNQNGVPMYSHVTQVQVRLQFLTSVFSSLGSPKSFRLSLEQVDALWEWLANDAECADCLFAWLQVQAKGVDQHALGIETLQHLYLRKLPELKPEGISMVALGLFQQLCSLARLAIAHYEKQADSTANIVGMNHLWKIALRAHNTEVSLAAIQYINSYYMGQQLKLEKEFVAHCMDHLIQAAEDLQNSENQENALMCVQRALMLLNTHLETFRRRYAYHLRRWALEGKGIGSHSNLRNEGMGPPIRIILQPAGLSEKSVLHLHACDLIADLKAEIAKWWETLQGGAKTSGGSAPVLGLLLSEGPLRLITQGQELTSDYDERSLGDVGFKDNQIVYVSLGGRGARRKESADHPSLQPPPPKECLPTVLLLQPKYFEELFRLMQTLGDMKMQGKFGNLQPHTKAQLLSRRVWDILAMLPTNPNLLESFKNLSRELLGCDTQSELELKAMRDSVKQKISELLDPNNLQKFMYSLHIVESLATKIKQSGCCGNEHNFKPLQGRGSTRLGSGPSKSSNAIHSSKKGTPKKLVEDVSSEEKGGSDENKTATQTKEAAENASKETEGSNDDNENEKENVKSSEEKKDLDAINIKWNEIFINSGGMRHLFDIFMSGVLQNGNYSSDSYSEWRHDCLASLLRIMCLLGFEELKPDDTLLAIPKSHPFMIEMMDVRPTLNRLSSILNDEANFNFALQLQFRTGFWGRAQVVQFVMNILVSFVHSSKEARDILWIDPEISSWLQKFILDDPEPAVRREICAGLYRVSLGNGNIYHELMAPLLQKLVSFLPVAEKMTFQNQNHHMASDEGKEPFGPACRDYFWLLSRLFDTLTPEIVKESLDDPPSAAIDIESLCLSISKSILDRDYFETRHGYQDDGLVGLINLIANLVKYDPPFKFSSEAQSFIEKLFECLFDLPSPQDRQKPKCKSQTSRAAAYDLLVELCRNCPSNYSLLHGKLLDQHRPGPHAPYPWDYWPRDDGRSECGYVGLTNLGATCYMASCIQHLYMMPQAREAILSVPPQAAQKHATTLHELQRMFAYLMESERKSYNPRSFCRVYQMDHQPLNTGEQKDMAEFFIDLVSKLEEMTPELKTLVKRLFCGTLSNNVVSLDCGHVSRTAEEFYTVRCQVADMRNLQESLDEVTVKDTLEGDNMYTCSQCGRKVRAEKRACFKKLPQILCFNTMRYTFNMVTMLKEKVNTHFSFPMRLDMSDYVEKTLMPHQYLEEKQKRERKISTKTSSDSETKNSNEGTEITKKDKEEASQSDGNSVEDEDEFSECCEYDLVGVTVHTGTADGGHYYSFIKERTDHTNMHQERWFLFNDAEVKLFDPSQIAAECFGGEMTSKTYDSVTEKYLDFSFEKTNSAYMLFYERRVQRNDGSSDCIGGPSSSSIFFDKFSSLISKEAKIIEEVVSASGSCPDNENNNNNNNNNNINNNNNNNNNKLMKELQKIQNETDIVNSSDLNLQTKLGMTNTNSSICDIDVKGNDAIKPSPQPTLSIATCSTAPIASTSSISNALIATPSTSAAAIASSSSSSLSTSSSSSSINNNLPLVTTSPKSTSSNENKSLLSKELEEWIWQDNRHFLQDKNIFEHTYFNFMWQICGHIPQTLLMQSDVTCIAAQLSVSFFIETFIHAKEKPTMVLWVELLTKQFNASQEACEWFLTQMSTEPWWPVQVLIQCPNQMVRQMFQRLVIHVIQRLRQSHYNLYLKTETDEDGKDVIGNASCITRFIKSLILLMEHGAKAHLRHLSEFFGLLYEFSRMGDEETLFLLRINVIRSVADFYLGNKPQDCIDTGSDNDDNSSDEALSVDKARPASLDKMIALVASLVERSRGPDFRLHLSSKDYNAIAGGKGFPFLYQQIKDNINPHQTRHLIHALCRWDERLANQIITMLFASVTKHTELCGPFFKLLTLLTEPQGGPSGLPCFSQLVLQRVWDAAEYCPQSALDWLAVQAPRNKIAHAWILQSAESWVEQFLMAHNNSRVRNAASYLLVSLVPSQSFRGNYRAHSLHKLPVNIPHRELSSDAQIILHTILNLLLRLLRPARAYTDIAIHGTAKLTAYFTLLTYCMVTKTEKLMLGPYMRALWELFHPRLSEPSVPAHHNKHALLAFWHHATNDCPENAQIIANCPDITRNIAFNYILADHDDSEIVAYNRAMLPAYYGLLRLCCQQSRSLTRQLAAHQNLQWAFKNITPHPTQYTMAADELFRLMTLFATRHPDATEQEQREVSTFRRTTLSAYLTGLDARVSWGTLIAALRILVDNDEDRIFVVYNGGIEMCFEALHTLHSMYHEATACHVSGDLQELLTELVLLVSTLRMSSRIDQKKRQQSPNSSNATPAIKGLPEALKRLATLLNTYNPPEMRNLTLDVLKEMVRNPNLEVTSILGPLFTHSHLSAENAPNSIGPLGPYFPRRGTKTPWPSISKSTPRPPRPMVQMSIPQNQIIQRGIDKEYDVHLEAFYKPYHDFLDIMMRMAVNTNQLNESLVKLSCLAAIEAAPLHFNLFPKFWVGIHNNKSTNKYADLLFNNSCLVEYVDILLRDERISLNDPVIRNFLEIYYPKITSRLAIARLIYAISYTLHSKDDLDELCGDLHAIRVIAQTTGVPASVRGQLRTSLKAVLVKYREELNNEEESPPKRRKLNPPSTSATETPSTQQQPSQNLDDSAVSVTMNTSSTLSETSEKSKPHDESNDADDENEEEDELDIDKVVDVKLDEEREKEKCFLKTIESYIEAILDLLNESDVTAKEESTTPSSSPAVVSGVVGGSTGAGGGDNICSMASTSLTPSATSSSSSPSSVAAVVATVGATVPPTQQQQSGSSSMVVASSSSSSPSSSTTKRKEDE